MRDGRPWVVLQHVAHEGPGAIALAVSNAGGELAVIRVDQGEPVPGAEVVPDMAETP